MSATNRGSKRHKHDLYSTPEHAFKPLIPYIKRLGVHVHEPACGDGRLLKWMSDEGIVCSGDDIINGYNFLKDETSWGIHAIVTNPPFSLALEFCDHAISKSLNVFMLLRLNFLASQNRKEWFLKNEPSSLFVLSKRPSFKCGGKTDCTDYAWFYWGNAYKGIHHL